MQAQRPDPLTEFTKTKMHFALALLGTLFALNPFVEKWGAKGFVYLGYDLRIFYAYSIIAGLLALTVYFYALALMSERAYSWMERAGNYSYALAIIVLPLYGGLYLSNLIAEGAGQAHLAIATPSIALGLGAGWLLLSWLLAWRLRKRLGDQDRVSKIEQLAEQEIVALNRARDLFQSNHFDLSVIENWKAIESRLRRVLLLHGFAEPASNSQALVSAVVRAKVIGSKSVEMIWQVRQYWNVAVSTEPLTREAAEAAAAATREILSGIAVQDAPAALKHPN
jgi:hypothetical protein